MAELGYSDDRIYIRRLAIAVSFPRLLRERRSGEPGVRTPVFYSRLRRGPSDPTKPGRGSLDRLGPPLQGRAVIPPLFRVVELFH